MKTKCFPDIIQGGMGVGVSLWPLARAVSVLGGIGVISGTLVEFVVARTLQMGDPCGYIRWALAPFNFPIKEVAERVIAKYYIPGGKAPSARFKDVPLFEMCPEKSLTDLIICANFVEVFLAKEGHSGIVGINLMEKVQFPTMLALYGAMLAGVDCVFMGAGTPKQIPRVLESLSRHDYTWYKIDVDGSIPGDDFRPCFDPKAFLNGKKILPLRRPGFFPIVSAPSTIKRFFMDEPGKVQGFVVELPPAGGHIRKGKEFNERGEPIFGIERSAVDWEGCVALDLPFWVGGGYASPEKLAEAQAHGAKGIQAGGIFSVCKESDMDKILSATVRRVAFRRELDVFTDPRASPSGLPFKVASIPDTLYLENVYNSRPRICDIGRLQTPYRKADGSVGFRCPAENVAVFVANGGKEEEAHGRKCLCNGLLATAGYPQLRHGEYVEPPIVTLSSDMSFVRELMKKEDDAYTAEDVMKYLRGGNTG